MDFKLHSWPFEPQKPGLVVENFVFLMKLALFDQKIILNTFWGAFPLLFCVIGSSLNAISACLRTPWVLLAGPMFALGRFPKRSTGARGSN